MEKENPKNTSSEIDSTLLNELDHLQKFSQSGLYNVIDSKNFKQIDSIDPKLIKLYRLEGMSNRASQLYRVLRYISSDSDVRDRIAGEIKKINSEAISEISKSVDEKNSDKNYRPSWMSNEEREGLYAVINLGFYEIISPENYPALASLEHETLKELKAEAVGNRINRLENMLELRNKALKKIGFNKTNDQDKSLESIRNKINELLEYQGHLILSK